MGGELSSAAWKSDVLQLLSATCEAHTACIGYILWGAESSNKEVIPRVGKASLFV